MDKKQFFLFALYVGAQSFLLQLVDQLIGKSLVPGGHSGFVFIAFQGWALYFLLGSTLKGAVTAFCGYIMGVLFSILMVGGSGVLAGLDILAVPVVALIVVPVMMYFEYAPWCIANVATFFVGAGAFFGVLNYVEGIRIAEASFIVLLYCAFGLASGYMTIWFRKRYECCKRLEKQDVNRYRIGGGKRT